MAITVWCPTLDDMDHGETREIPQAVEQSAWREFCAQELGAWRRDLTDPWGPASIWLLTGLYMG